MKSYALALVACCASAVTLDAEYCATGTSYSNVYQPTVLPGMTQAHTSQQFVQPGTAYIPGSTNQYIATGAASQRGKFVDLCPNAGVCDSSSNQTVGSVYTQQPGAFTQQSVGSVYTQQPVATELSAFNVGVSPCDVGSSIRALNEQIVQQQLTQNVNPYVGTQQWVGAWEQPTETTLLGSTQMQNLKEQIAQQQLFEQEQEFKKQLLGAAIQKKLQEEAIGQAINQAKFERAQQNLAIRQAANERLGMALENLQAQQLATRDINTTQGFVPGSTTQIIRPLGCTPTKVPAYSEADQPGVNEYAFCGEKNLRGSQTLKRTNIHHNYVHDVNHLHNYHNRTKHSARQFNTVVKDCSCVGESEQVQGCPCDPAL
jgi:hypothetical protein